LPCEATVVESADAAARAHMTAALGTAQKIAPMPQVCAQLAELTSKASADAAQYARLIQGDPSLAGEVIRMANSPGLRPRSSVVTLQQAISWLGIAEVRNIALAIMLRGDVYSAPGHERQAQCLWQEGWLAALWAKEIARMRRKHVETSFLAALMFRAGAALALKVLSRYEAEHGGGLDARLFDALILEFEASFGLELMQGWRIAAEIQAGVSGWRDFLNSAQPEISATVNAAQLLSTHTLYPDLITADLVLAGAAFEALGVFPADRQSLLERTESIRAMGAI
jgi:HD-like signal output (HDOD) protein